MCYFVLQESYVKSIGKAITHFQEPLVAQAESFQEDKASISKIFGNLKLIHGFNAKLLSELKKIAEEWTPESSIGATFVKFTPFLKMYADYSNKYEDALSVFQSLMEKKEVFRNVHASDLSWR